VDEDDRRALRITPLPEADGAAIQKPQRTLSRRFTQKDPIAGSIASPRAAPRSQSNKLIVKRALKEG